MAEIEAHGLTRKFGDFTAVRNLHLQVAKGTIFGFLGPNGSGKSTTVKMLTGLLKPTAGEAFIAGDSILSSPIKVKQKIGVLPEDLALFDPLTIWEHLTMVGPIYGLSRQETAARAEQLLNFLDLWPSRDTYIDQASYGMKKKCSLAMALLHNPQVLFLDEPFEGIDPVASRNIKDLLLLMAGKGTTIFLTSHILEVVERLVQSFGIIVAGEMVCTQTVAETLQSCEAPLVVFITQGSKANPGLELANAFSVYTGGPALQFLIHRGFTRRPGALPSNNAATDQVNDPEQALLNVHHF